LFPAPERLTLPYQRACKPCVMKSRALIRSFHGTSASTQTLFSLLWQNQKSHVLDSVGTRSKSEPLSIFSCQRARPQGFIVPASHLKLAVRIAVAIARPPSSSEKFATTALIVKPCSRTVLDSRAASSPQPRVDLLKAISLQHLGARVLPVGPLVRGLPLYLLQSEGPCAVPLWAS
jgi:hypothetical protein